MPRRDTFPSALGPPRPARRLLLGLVVYLQFSLFSGWLAAQSSQPPVDKGAAPTGAETSGDRNKRLAALLPLAGGTRASFLQEYRIGPEDLLEITVFEAPELNRSVRVSASGEISLPLLGVVKTAGLVPRELEVVLQELLRRSYMKDPHVGVFVREMQSHPVSVFGAVKRPGVFQIRGSKSLVEVLSMAEGLAEDAGDTVLVLRGAGPGGAANPAHELPGEAPRSGGAMEFPAMLPPGAESVEINLKLLLDSGDPRHNLTIHPGDIVKVPRAGIIYVVGEVKKPGGFILRSNENISVLQAIALGEGLTRTAAKSRARIIRTDEKTGQRTEIAVDLGRILAGRAPDPPLRPRDIVFIPNSAARSAWARGFEITLQTVSGVVIFRR